MKVLGQLEGAQLEQIADPAPTPAPTGRIFMDVTDPLAAVPRVHDGSGWRALELGQSSSLVSQDSADAVTVDWSQGLNQEVVLTGRPTITFENPQDGKLHRLVVRTTSSQNFIPNFVFANTDIWCQKNIPYQRQGYLPAGESIVFTFFYSEGVRPALTAIPSTALASATLSTLATGIDIPNNNPIAICMGRTSSPFLENHELGVNEMLINRFDRAYFSPTAITEQARGVAYSPEGGLLFSAMNGTPYIQMSTSSKLGAINGGNFSNPSSLPAGAGQCVAVHPSGKAVVVGHTTTPFMSAYVLIYTGFGSKWTNPGTLPAAQVTSAAFSFTGDYLAVASQTTPFLQVYPVSVSVLDTVGTNLFGGIVGAPGTLPAGGPAGQLGKGVAWRPQGDLIALAMTTTPYIYVVEFNRSSGTFGASISMSALSGAATCVQWSKCGNFLLVGTGTTPYLYCYKWDGASFTAVTNSQTVPAGQINDIVVHPDNSYFVCAMNVSPFYYAGIMPQVEKNWIRIS